MRLLERLPHLPEGEGNLWTHRTGGEHSTKFIGTEYQYNPMRQAELRTQDGSEIPDFTHDEMTDMLLGGEHEIVFVDRQNLSKDKDGKTGLVGAAIGQREKVDRFGKRMVIRELVVHPDLRKQKVASFMLGRLTNEEIFGTGNLTEMVVDTSHYVTDDWFLGRLEDAGFKHTDDNGSPAMWLPGNTSWPKGDVDDPDFVKQVLAPMPEGWHGYFVFYPETDPQTQVFRDGKLLGIIRSIEGSTQFDNDFDNNVADFSLTDAGDVGIGEVKGVTRDEAIMALLNNYELVQ